MTVRIEARLLNFRCSDSIGFVFIFPLEFHQSRGERCVRTALGSAPKLKAPEM